jgi:hypothetical protein
MKINCDKFTSYNSLLIKLYPFGHLFQQFVFLSHLSQPVMPPAKRSPSLALVTVTVNNVMKHLRLIPQFSAPAVLPPSRIAASIEIFASEVHNIANPGLSASSLQDNSDYTAIKKK